MSFQLDSPTLPDAIQAGHYTVVIAVPCHTILVQLNVGL